MLDQHGFVDTLQTYGPRIYAEDTNESVANQFAAMPSLHFGWALLIALMFIRIKRTRWSWVALAHPAITLLAIVATANHYLADAAVAGVLVIGVDSRPHPGCEHGSRAERQRWSSQPTRGYIGRSGRKPRSNHRS